MKKMKRLMMIFGATAVLSLNMGGLFMTIDNVPTAQAAKFSPVIADSIPEEKVNTKIKMGVSTDSQNITAVQAKNIPDEKINTEIKMGVSTDSQKITAVKVKNIPDEEVTTKVPFNF